MLIISNGVIPVFFLERLEAQVVVLTLVASMILMTVLTAFSGFKRLLGLGHVLWIPLIYFLWLRLEQNPADDFFGIWTRVLMTLNATSLVIDSVDVGRYIVGDRSETVQGL